MNKPFSQACENNKEPILHKIRDVFAKKAAVWEIGSGTGQHASHFAKSLPHLVWQPTDRAENLAGINAWVQDAGLANLRESLELDVNHRPWPCTQIDALFTANTLHIMHWQEVERFFAALEDYLAANAKVCIYGAFNYDGHYTSPSNARFDQWLKARDPESGIRDFEKIAELAAQAHLETHHDFAMPANNRLLVMQRLDTK